MTCRPPKSLTNALAQADAIAPNRHRDPESDGICADPRHLAGGTSDHIPDSRGIPHAVDVDHDPENGYDAHAWADTVRTRCDQGGPDAPPCTYIISNHRIASAQYEWTWRTYTGDDPHESHAHYSIRRTTEAETWAGQWWQGDDAMTDADRTWLTGELDARAFKQAILTLEVEQRMLKRERRRWPRLWRTLKADDVADPETDARLSEIDTELATLRGKLAEAT